MARPEKDWKDDANDPIDLNPDQPRQWCGIEDSGDETTLDNLMAIHYRWVVNKLDSTFAALADPTRRAMVIKLAVGPASIHDLSEPFPLSQQMISKHVACLVRARLVVKQRRGRESICTLRPTAIKAVADWAFDFRRLWEESFDKLDVVLQKMKTEETTHDKSSNQ